MTAFQKFMNSLQISQYRFHKATGISKSQISEWQSGKHRPSLKSAQRIAIGLGLSIQNVLGKIETRECSQNYRMPDGSFVPRTKENSPSRPSSIKSNESTRTSGVQCILCRQMLGKAA